MSKLDDILNSTGATLYCLGQDYQKGDGSPFKVDTECDKEKQEVKTLMLEIFDGVGHGLSWFEAKDMLRKKVEEL